jgi:hypothetical protein
MAERVAKRVRVWFDSEAVFWEVVFSEAPGYVRETANDAVMERVAAEALGESLPITSPSGCRSDCGSRCPLLQGFHRVLRRAGCLATASPGSGKIVA